MRNKLFRRWLFTLLGLFPMIDSASAATIWQIGYQDNGQTTNHYSEFLPGTQFYNSFTYNVTTNPDNSISHPLLPGYLGNTSLYYIDPLRYQIAGANTLEILFSLDTAMDNVVFNYGRGGSETDNMWLDHQNGGGITPGPAPAPGWTIVGPGEGLFSTFAFNFGNLAAGQHSITLQYAGGGWDNGHYIDYMTLSGNASNTAVPEPGTALLFLGSGLISLRKKLKLLA